MDNSEKRYRKLLVDDEPSITQTFELGLTQYGFQVDTFNNPISALASYKPGSYDLLLFDIRMPIMNGFELYKDIRKSDERVKICFNSIMSTGFSMICCMSELGS